MTKAELQLLSYHEPFGGNKDLAETFILAIHGCIADEPSIKTLRSRSALIVDRFVRK
jgi:hypothetical protein